MPVNTIISDDLGKSVGGTSGDDVIYALGGDDLINPGKGHDVVHGGAGLSDVINLDYTNSLTPVVMSAPAPSGPSMVEPYGGIVPGGVTTQLITGDYGSIVGQTVDYSGFPSGQFTALFWGASSPELAVDGTVDSPNEHLAYSSGIGTSSAVWTGSGTFNGNPVMTRFTETIDDGLGTWLDATALGLTGGPAVVAQVTGTSFDVTIKFEVSEDGGTTWQALNDFDTANSNLSQSGIGYTAFAYDDGGYSGTIDNSGDGNSVSYDHIESLSVTGGHAGDTLAGGAFHDDLRGGDGDDIITGGAGNDTIMGGAGTGDIAVFSGNRAQYTISADAGDAITVSGPDGSDGVYGVETLRFDDGDVAANNPPAVDLNGPGGGVDFSGSYTEQGPGAAIGATIDVTDPDSGDRIEGATITIANPNPGDTLDVGTLPAGISVASNTGTQVVLTGVDTQAHYEQALAAITFSSSSDDPTAGGNTSRTINVSVQDYSATSAAATATIAVTAVNDAPAFNQYAHFDGASYVDISDPAMHSGTGAFSYNVVFRTSATGTTQTLLSNGPFVPNASATLAVDPGGNLNFTVNNAFYIFGPAVANGQWHDATITYDGAGNYLLYLDGAQVGAHSGAGVNIAAGPALIGAANSDHRNLFIGDIAEANVWNRALAASEANTVGTPHDESAGLLGSYRFESSAQPGENSVGALPDGLVTGTLPIPAQAGAVGETAGVTGDATVHTAGGAILFNDPDSGDTHNVSVTAHPGAYVGTLTPTLDNAHQQVSWSYSVADSALDFLAAGQTQVQTYDLAVTDGGGLTATTTVTMTLTGSNDAPVISIESGGDRAVSTIQEGDTPLGLFASLTVRDPDLTDTVTASVVGVVASGTTLGLGSDNNALKAMMSLTAGAIAANPTDAHNLDWLWISTPETFDYLDDGESLTLTYTIQVDDGHGGTDAQDLTVTINGTNDAPVIQVNGNDSAAADVTDGNAQLFAAGTLTAVDPDLSDAVAASVVGVTGLPVGADPANFLGMLQVTPGAIAADPAGGHGNLGWTFGASASAFDYLAAGESQALHFTVRVTDDSGVTADRDVAITVHGINDDPFVTSAVQSATAVVELADHAPGENSATLATDGTIYFSDTDLSDAHVASISAHGGNYLGSLVLGAVNDASHSLGWTFSVGDGALDSFAGGQTLHQVYTITIDDGHGGTTSQDIAVDLVGTNDAAILSSDNVVLVQGFDPVAASGALTISDVDNPALFQAQSNAQGNYGRFSIASDGQWSYLADSAYQSLAPNAALTDSFTVLAADGTPTSVTVTIAGSAGVSIARPDSFLIGEGDSVGGSLFDDNGAGPDASPNNSLEIASVNGVAANVGHGVQLASGALVLVNADGTFSYDPNHAFDWLTSAAGAANSTGQDSFTYALAGGSSATVYVDITGSASPGDKILGNVLDNAISGLAGDDAFQLQQGGHDTASGLGGNDGFYFGAALDAGDSVDGGDGTDTIAVQGNTNLTLGDIRNVEVLDLVSGSDPSFGDTAGNHYSYDLTTQDANVAAGATFTVVGTGLQPGENMSFDGSAETDGNFRIFAGQGTDDLIGGGGSDGFFFGSDGNLTGADHVDGGAGVDTLALRGNYVGANAVVFQDGSFSNVEVLALLSSHTNEYSGQIVATGFDYDVTMADGNVAAGQHLDINAGLLGTDETLSFDGSAETDGSFRIFSGAGNDTLTGGGGNDLIYGGLGADALDGGAGADEYVYRSAAESTSTGYDTITGFDWHVDRIDAPGGARAFSQAGSGALSTASFDSDLTADLGGVLGAGQAALFTASSGTLAGHVFAVIDVNGVAGYQAGADLVIELVAPVTPIDVHAAVIV